MQRLYWLVLTLILFLPGQVMGQTRPVVVQVKDAISFQLDNGKVMRLAGIAGPWLDPFMDHRSARGFLEKHLLHKAIPLEVEAFKKDRYGNVMINLELPDGSWLNGELVRRGWARVFSTTKENQRHSELLLLEKDARENKRGQWGRKEGFRIIPADPFRAKAQGFMLISGRVLKVAKRQNFTYLNFGEDWKKDFTISIENRIINKYNKEIFLNSLSKHEVLVRGWVQWRNGPLVEIHDFDMLEMLTDKAGG